MAISLANQNTKSEAAVTSTNITFTASENDIVLVGIMSSATTDRTFSEGGGTWTKIAEIYSNDANDTNLAVFKKRMGASPDTSVTLTISSTAVTLLTHARVYSGVDTTTEEDATATTATGVNGATPDPAAITTVTNGAVVVTYVASTDAVTVTNPSTNYGNLTQIGTAGTGTRTLIGQDRTITTAGAEDPGGLTDLGGSGDQSWSAITIALRPAAGGSTYTLDADAASYTYSATDAGLEFGRLIDAAAASYAYTANDATLTRDIPLSADAASYAYTASDASLEYTSLSTYTLDADTAAYAWTATDAGLLFGYLVDADTAAYNWVANDAGLEYSTGVAAPPTPVPGAGGGRKRKRKRRRILLDDGMIWEPGTEEEFQDYIDRLLRAAQARQEAAEPEPAPKPRARKKAPAAVKTALPERLPGEFYTALANNRQRVLNSAAVTDAWAKYLADVDEDETITMLLLA